MTWFNESEIDMYANRFPSHPVLGKATRFLQRFRDEINSKSDGWCYWKPPARAAKKLMDMIASAGVQYPVDPTEADFKKALTPIKTFCTKHAKNGIVMPPIE